MNTYKCAACGRQTEGRMFNGRGPSCIYCGANLTDTMLVTVPQASPKEVTASSLATEKQKVK